jgi:hypothetical protein
MILGRQMQLQGPWLSHDAGRFDEAEVGELRMQGSQRA